MEKFINDERVVYVFSKEECIDLEKDFWLLLKMIVKCKMIIVKLCTIVKILNHC